MSETTKLSQTMTTTLNLTIDFPTRFLESFELYNIIAKEHDLDTAKDLIVKNIKSLDEIVTFYRLYNNDYLEFPPSAEIVKLYNFLFFKPELKLKIVTFDTLDGTRNYLSNVLPKDIGMYKMAIYNGPVMLYNGTFIDGKFHGSGQLNAKDYTYIGEFRNGMRHGTGTLTMILTDACYTGEWENDRCCGTGTNVDSHGTKYVGQVRDSMYNGFGCLTKKDGTTYTGQFVDWLYHGHGELFRVHKNVNVTYVGEFKDGEIESGVETWSDGQVYTGQFRDGKRHGHGTYTWPDGTKYVGSFNNNKKHGTGTLYKNGKIIPVSYVYGQRQHVAKPSAKK